MFWIITTLFLVSITFLIRQLLLIAVVDGQSMMPTLQPGHRLLVWRGFVRPILQKNQSIVIIDSKSLPDFNTEIPDHIIMPQQYEEIGDDSWEWEGEMLQTNWETPYLIKRLVGLPGDDVRVHQSNFPQYDTISPDKYDGEYAIWTVPDKHYFVLGDNPKGTDSRSWGPLPLNALKGVAFYQFSGGQAS